MEGKLVELAVLLIFAREKVLNGRMMIPQCIRSQILSLIDEEVKLMRECKHRELTQIHQKMMGMSSTVLLLEVFERAGHTIGEYLQSQQPDVADVVLLSSFIISDGCFWMVRERGSRKHRTFSAPWGTIGPPPRPGRPTEMAYATARPVVTIQTFNSYMSTDKDALPLPSVMETPIHPDIVTHVHSLVSKNSCQPYAVSSKSWQPDLCRVMGHRPRRGTNLSVPGGRTHRASQGAFGNSCRGGRMFSAICFDFDLRVPIIMSSSPSADKAETIEEKLKQSEKVNE